MTSSRKAERVVRRQLADGTQAEYRYPAWSGKPKAPRFAADSVAALIAAYKRSPAWNALAQVTRDTYEIYLRQLERSGLTIASEMKRRDLLEIRDAIALQRGNGAAASFMRVTSRVFSWAVDRNWIEHSPATRGRGDLPSGNLPAWTTQEAALALEHLPEHLRRVVVLGIHTAQRSGDMTKLTWSNYDGEKLRFRQSKTKRDMVILASDILRNELDMWRRGATSTLILTDQNGLPWLRNNLSMAMSRGLALVDGMRPGLNVHGLRKLAATIHADAGASVHEIAAMTGHKTLSMVALYTASVDQEKLATAAVHRLQTPSDKRRVSQAKRLK